MIFDRSFPNRIAHLLHISNFGQNAIDKNPGRLTRLSGRKCRAAERSPAFLQSAA
jgi:hypothetical protein